MNDTKKISIISLFVLFLGFAGLFIFVEAYELAIFGDIISDENDTTLSDSDVKRVFFFGGSAVINLNMTYIQDTVSSRGLHQFQIYNLAWPWDHPSERIKKLDELIAAKPTLVLYGLEFASFGYTPRIDSPKCADSDEPLLVGLGDENTLTFLPSYNEVLPTVDDAVNFFGKNIPIKLDGLENFVNPKHVTVNVLRVVFEGGDLTTNTKTLPALMDQKLFDLTTLQKTTGLMSKEELSNPWFNQVNVCPEELQRELKFAKQIIRELLANNIDVIIFSPSYAREFLNGMGENNINYVINELENFSEENDISYYDLHDKYTELDVWYDWLHVAVNPAGLIYSKDITEIILENIEPYVKLKKFDTTNDHLTFMDLSYADMRSVDLSNKNLTGSDLRGSNFLDANLDGTILLDTDLSYSYLVNADLSGKDLSDTILTGANLAGVNLNGVSLSGKDLTRTDLTGVDLSYKDLSGTILTETRLDDTNLTGVDLSGKDLSGTSLKRVDLSDKDFTGTILTGADLSLTDLKGIDLSGKDLRGTSLRATNLSEKDFSGTILTGTSLGAVAMYNVDLSGKDMTGSEFHYAKIFESNFSGANFTGVTFYRAEVIRTDLSNADLSDVNLRAAKLDYSNFDGVDFTGFDLTATRLKGVDLTDKDLTGTILRWTNFASAILDGVDLSHLILFGTNFTGVDLSGKDFSGTNSTAVDFSFTNLTGAKLHMISIHSNFSSADITNGDLANAFLPSADFSNANLQNANLAGANLKNANLAGANLKDANLEGAHLTGVTLTCYNHPICN